MPQDIHWFHASGSPAHFGRVYAAYGGIFVVLSIFWGWEIDQIRPDRFDLIGGLVCLVGVCVTNVSAPGKYAGRINRGTPCSVLSSCSDTGISNLLIFVID